MILWSLYFSIRPLINAEILNIITKTYQFKKRYWYSIDVEIIRLDIPKIPGIFLIPKFLTLSLLHTLEALGPRNFARSIHSFNAFIVIY